MAGFAFNHHAVAQFVGIGEIEFAVELDFVNLGQLETRVGELLGKFAVVGQQKESFAVHVEATDVKDPGPIAREQVVNRLGAAFGDGAAKVTARLVKHRGEGAFGMNAFSSNGNAVIVADANGQFVDTLAVNEDLPG